ncbi:MAG: AsmA family protein [Woeseiaceae bacterium]|nr:AsmA family protein [Woeseiaceae bacterium]
MDRLLKIILYLLAGVVGIVVIAVISAVLFFDPNNFRDRIQVAVNESTGRDLVIGDLDLSVFPRLAINIGPSELGNAEGFDTGQFLSFDSASLSVRILPLIFSQKVVVGTASLDGLEVNLEVSANYVNNWDDLSEGGGDSPSGEDTDSGTGVAIDVANIAVTNANVSYSDRGAASSYAVSGLSFETSRIAADVPIDIRAEFDFTSSDGVGGHVAMRNVTTISESTAQITVDGLNIAGSLEGIVSGPTSFNFDSRSVRIDTAAGRIDAGEMSFTILGVSMSADVEPFSYAETPQPTAALRVAAFSLKELMQTLDMEPPATFDSAAMQSVSFSANAVVGQERINLSAMSLELDDSTMTGTMSLPMTVAGVLGFDLEVDRIVLDGYMAPAGESAAGGEEDSGDMEIPTDLVRALNVDGNLRINETTLSGMTFTNMEVGVTAGNGRLRLFPLGAEFYYGTYVGDVRINASFDVPTISVNERISGVDIGRMMTEIFDTDNVTGTINGHFQLAGAGKTMSAIQQDLDGTMSFELADGVVEGTDIWHQLRSARAIYRMEPVPELVLPARTEFSAIKATGVVTDGVFTNDDFIAELPFLRLNGAGMVDLGTREVDYALEVRVFDHPEFMAGATAEELADFTETVVPLKITGPMASPRVRPDIEGIFRARVEEAIEEQKKELRDNLLNRLLGGDDAERDPEAEDKDPEEKLKKNLLKKLFEN